MSEKASPVVPGAPTITGVKPEDSRLWIYFESMSDGGSLITAYTARTNQGHVVDTRKSPVAVSGLINGEPYTVAVLATNKVGDGPLSAWSEQVCPRTVPSPPGLLTASVEDSQTQVSFTPSRDDGGSPIIAYTATASPVGGGNEFRTVGTSSPLMIVGLTNGVSYRISVIARNEAGNSGLSLPQAIVTPAVMAEKGAPWKPFPDCVSFELTTTPNQAQLQKELNDALKTPVQLSAIHPDPTRAEGVLWVTPADVDQETVRVVLADHVADPNWGISQWVLDFQELSRKVISEPDSELTASEIQTAIKGLLVRTTP